MHEPNYNISQINSIDEMNVAVNGLYATLAFYLNWYDEPPQYFADDFGYFGAKYSELGDFAATDRWQKLYSIVASANNIICQFQNNPNIKTEMKAGLGEAYLFRAYAYYRLVRIFGRVPLVKNTVVNTTLALSSFSDVYSFIESDLLKAAYYLPVTKSSARVPNQSPVSGSAKAMLAEVYLTMGGYPVLDNNKYLQAAQVAKNVIDSANVYGFNLLPDYANLWDGNHE